MDVMLVVVKGANSFHSPVLTSRNVDLFTVNPSNFPAQQASVTAELGAQMLRG